MVEQKSWLGRVGEKAIYLPVLSLAVLTFIPYYFMFIGAFKPLPELKKVPPTFYVERPTLNNFYDPEGLKPPDHQEGIFQRYKDVPGRFFRFYSNSIAVSAGITIGVLTIGSLAAYVLAKHRFPGRRVFFIMFIASMMVPWQVMLIPGFLLMRDFSWIDTFQALIIPALPKAFVVFFLHQFMISIPDELLDAARIDGAHELRIWWQIILPLVRPALIAMGIFVFLGEWNNFVWPLIIIQSNEKWTLPLALSLLNSNLNGAANLGLMMATAMLVSLPTLVMFVIFQKQFVRGIALTGIKG